MDVCRVTRSKKQVKSNYDRLSKWYDLFASPFEGRFINAGLQMLHAAPGEIILEIGFGTGYCILKLAQAAGDSGRVCGIDISEKMCGITQMRVEKAGFSKRVQLVNGDALNLPFSGSSFNAIFMSFVIELFDTPERVLVLKECQRVLKKDGRLCVVAMKQRHTQTPMLKLYEWAHRKFPAYIDCRPIFVREMLEDAGFLIYDATEISSLGLPVEIVVCGDMKI